MRVACEVTKERVAFGVGAPVPVVELVPQQRGHLLRDLHPASCTDSPAGVRIPRASPLCALVCLLYTSDSADAEDSAVLHTPRVMPHILQTDT